MADRIMKKLSVEDRWNGEAKKRLLGRRIVGVRYMSMGESSGMGWSRRPVVLQLEGNDAGALHGQDSKGGSVGLPVL